MSLINNHISYIEFKANDLKKVKEFYSNTFDWVFTDYGPDYTVFAKSGVLGGFEKTEDHISNGALIVLYHSSLDTIKSKITESKGEISKDIFSFPGGRRFHFIDPSGNELAVWSDK